MHGTEKRCRWRRILRPERSFQQNRLESRMSLDSQAVPRRSGLQPWEPGPGILSGEMLWRNVSSSSGGSARHDDFSAVPDPLKELNRSMPLPVRVLLFRCQARQETRSGVMKDRARRPPALCRDRCATGWPWPRANPGSAIRRPRRRGPCRHDRRLALPWICDWRCAAVRGGVPRRESASQERIGRRSGPYTSHGALPRRGKRATAPAPWPHPQAQQIRGGNRACGQARLFVAPGRVRARHAVADCAVLRESVATNRSQ